MPRNTEMNTDTIAQIQAFGDHLRSVPTTWHEIEPLTKLTLLEAMMPDPLTGFCEQAREWLYSWWLPCGVSDVQLLNTIGNYSAREDVDGTLYLSAALLTDAVMGRRLDAALPMLESKVLTHESAITWPQPETEEI